MKFFSIKNHISVTTNVVEEPWKLSFPYPANVLTKDNWRRWCKDPNTEHCFLSCVEGMSAAARICEDNKVFQVHGLLVDYDAPYEEDEIIKAAGKKVSEFLPQYACQTFSKHARTFYRFEKPILIVGERHYREFAKLLAKKLKLDKHLLGFEPRALEDPSKYYDFGRSWHPISPDDAMPFSTLTLWAYEASKKVNLAPSEYNIPLDDVAAEVERKYPGRWSGDFIEGQRGVRFWDPQADNETAAVVTPHGMLCYTGNQPFVTWRDIFGAGFVDAFEAKKIEKILDCTWYDGRQYWFRDDERDGLWMPTSKDDFSQRLRVMKFDPVRPKGKTCSEVDDVEFRVKLDRRVDAAAPFLYRQPGRIVFNNKIFLNTSRVKCMQPVPEALCKPNPSFDDLAEHCGRLLYPYLCCFFDNRNNRVQLWHFLAWLKHFYVNAYRGRPQPGQVPVFAGPPSTGKTFMIQAVLAPLMGGRAKADDFLSGKNKWTEALADAPVLSVDDSEGAGGDHNDQIAMTQRLKAIVANKEMLYAAKFGAEMTIEWLGRIAIGCNLEAHSIARILPDVNLSAYNKIMLFRTANPQDKFTGFLPTEDENRAVLAEELPYFARWLIEWVPPEFTNEEGEHRFGVKAYHHPELLKKSQHGSTDNVVWDAILNMLEERQKNFKKEEIKSGAASVYRANTIRLHLDLINANPSVMRDIKIQSLARCLSSLVSKGRPIAQELDARTGQEIWCISHDPKEEISVGSE